MNKLLFFSIFCVSCSLTSPSKMPDKYVEVIKIEWARAGSMLNLVGVTRANFVSPEICIWIPHDGPLESYANGEFNPNIFTIRWNIHTPTVIRHEAGHAILRHLKHICWACWSVDSKITVHSGKCETSLVGYYCGELLK